MEAFIRCHHAFLYAFIFISSLQTWSLRYLCPWFLKYFFLPLSCSLTVCIYFLSFFSHLYPSFTEPDCGKKQKLAEIHQALIRWKRYHSFSFPFIEAHTLITTLKYFFPTEEFPILTFECAVIQWTLRPWGKQQPRREDCSQMKWGERPGPNC